MKTFGDLVPGDKVYFLVGSASKCEEFILNRIEFRCDDRVELSLKTFPEDYREGIKYIIPKNESVHNFILTTAYSDLEELKNYLGTMINPLLESKDYEGAWNIIKILDTL